MKKPIKRILLLCILPGIAILVFSCAGIAQAIGNSADDMGDSKGAGALSRSAHSIGKALEKITPEQEYFIGRAVGAHLLTNYQLYDENPDLTLYLNQITAAIMINSPKPIKDDEYYAAYNGYHTAILDSTEINAFATSGGHIFITRGLLNCASSEDTLAAIIAHEIAHIQLQHSIKAITSNRVISAITETSSAVSSIALSELTEILEEAANEIVTSFDEGYSQNQEFEADYYALELLTEAGYEPSSLDTMLQALKQNQPRHPGGFNKTHPTPEDRIEQLIKPLRQYKDARDTRVYRETRFSAVK